MKRLASGKTKDVYELEDPSLVLITFRDDVTALDGRRRDYILSKGEVNAEITAKLMSVLESHGVATHFVKLSPPRSIVAKKLSMIPVEVVCRNIATGHLVKRLPFKEGEVLDPPIVELFLKDDERGDPMVNPRHLAALRVATMEECRVMEEVALRVNEVLKEFLASKSLKLLDFKIELGRAKGGELLIGDELDPDCMRIRDAKTGRVLDKDLYRQGRPLSEVMEAYLESRRRIVEGS
ncbi:MAG: phosphoribosylaminoimidazolesuccinocarboxamide synthase [Candidatus Nezhaarchaeota archaeon]|nr:phosphoribosylaminoimidazolesuccinocarboxamide synthase [Candidatus Nezhaarchaeota archaeon]